MKIDNTLKAQHSVHYLSIIKMNEERKARHESKKEFIKPKFRQEMFVAYEQEEVKPPTPKLIEIKPIVEVNGQAKRRT